jgi:hypothetical protein
VKVGEIKSSRYLLHIYNKLEGKERHYWTPNINSNKKIPINKDLFTWIWQVYVEEEKGEIFLLCVKDFVGDIFLKIS